MQICLKNYLNPLCLVLCNLYTLLRDHNTLDCCAFVTLNYLLAAVLMDTRV